MAPDIARLKRRSEFLQVARTRRKWVAPGLILQVRRHGTSDIARRDKQAVRVGFTVSRKVGNAIARNRARRRLRAVVEQVMPVEAKEGHDFVVIGRQATLKRPFAALLSDLQTALKRLDVCRSGSTAAAPRQPVPEAE